MTATVDPTVRPRAHRVDRGRCPITGDTLDGRAIARYVSAQVRTVGKHFLPEPLLAGLNHLRRRHAGRDPMLDAFLHCTLDKHDGRFWNRTYLALPVLERLANDPEHMATQLVADIVRFELTAQTADRPDAATLRKRLRHAARFIAPADDEQLARVSEFSTEGLPPEPADEWFAHTVQPVSVLHDEYFFIRVLQAHEMIFAVIVDHMRTAIAALRDGDPRRSAAAVHSARDQLQRAAGLFRIAATMRPEAFHGFREYTQGASAIQSEQYKRFEIFCGHPAPTRAASPAFDNVPAVRAEAMLGQDTLTDAYRQAPADHQWLLDPAIAALETAHHKWKTAHVSLATRMLGDAHGSGYTAGVPYLKDALGNRLFRGVDGCPLAH